MCRRLPDITPKLNGEILARAEQIIKDENLTTSKSDFDITFNRAIVEFGFDVDYYNMKMSEIGSEDCIISISVIDC